MTKYRKIGADVAMEILGGMLIALGVYNFALEADFPGGHFVFPAAGTGIFRPFHPVYGAFLAAH